MAKFTRLSRLLLVPALASTMFTGVVANAAPSAAHSVHREVAPESVRCATASGLPGPETVAQAPEARAFPQVTANPAAADAATYAAPDTPLRMVPDDEYQVPVSIRNTTAAAWPKTTFVLSYHWTLPDGTDATTSSNRLETTLPADLAPGESVTLDAKVIAPQNADIGNLVAVTDPKSNATAEENDYTSRYVYDELGHLTTVTDNNGNTTIYADYDANGFPRRVTDALNCSSFFHYDDTGNVVSTVDAKRNVQTFTFDIFKRPLSARVPKDAAAGQFIVTPGAVYDQNDNVVKLVAANGAVTTSAYDEMDQPVAVTCSTAVAVPLPGFRAHVSEPSSGQADIASPPPRSAIPRGRDGSGAPETQSMTYRCPERHEFRT